MPHYEKNGASFFFSDLPTIEKAFSTDQGGQSVINMVVIVSTAYSCYIKKREAIGVSPDGMPFTESGCRLPTVKLPKYPYDTEHDLALPVSSLYYDIPGFTPIDMRRGERIDGKELFKKAIWRYRHDDDV